MITIDKKDIIVAILIASNKSLTDLDVYDLKEHNITIDECDIFRLVELFAMGDLDIGKHTTHRTKDRKYLAKLIEFVRRKLRLHKLYLYIQSFKLRRKY